MEKNFELSQGDLRIRCVLTEPDYGTIRRVILGVHGLGGCAEDEIQAGIAEEMGLFSAATLRFDFPDHGRSPMGPGTFTLENCMESLWAAALYLKERYPDVEDLCIFATGFGAYVTLISLQDLQELPGNLRLVIQTPSVQMDKTLLSMIGISKQTLRALDRYTIATPRPLELTYSFLKELEAHVALTAYTTPMLILQGEEDSYIRGEDIRNFHQINERSKLVIIPGASHRFLEEGAWDMVLDLTRDWFEFEQVLLSDWT